MKHFITLFISCCCFHLQHIHAQEIKGDTIYLNENNDVGITFPSKKVDYFTPNPVNAAYNIRSVYQGIGLSSKTVNTETAYLSVVEGGRKHSFVLVYKKNIDLSGLDYDYSTIEKLKKRVDELNYRNKVKEDDLPKQGVSNKSKFNNQAKVTPVVTSVKSSENNSQNPPTEKNINYEKAVASGNFYFKNKDYLKAKDDFEKALELKPGNQYAVQMIARIEKIKSDKKVIEEQTRIEEYYKSNIDSAQKNYNRGNWVAARQSYEKALTVKENDPLSTNRIKDIDKKINLENIYADAIGNADRFFQQNMFAEAKEEYKKASSYFIDRPWPKEQIIKINSSLKDEAVKLAREQELLKKEKTINTKYETQIKRADTEFDKNNYAAAKVLYKDANNLKPAEAYPKERISIIEATQELERQTEKVRIDSIARGRKRKNDYESAMLKGSANEQKGDLNTAEKFYEAALIILPLDEAAQKKLESVRIKKIEIQKQQEEDSLYESKIKLGDNQILTLDYTNAITAFEEAGKIKPDKIYPKKRITFILNDIEFRRKDSIIKKQRKFDAAYYQGQNEMKSKNYNKAYKSFMEADSIHPNNPEVQQYLKIITNQLNKPAEIYQPPVAKIFKYQAEPFPYSLQELSEKYPDINFSKVPATQRFANKNKTTKKAPQYFNEVLAAASQPSGSATYNFVTAICEAVVIKEQFVYFKFLVQNNSRFDFLTGEMKLSLTNIPAKIVYPIALYPDKLPIIKSENEVHLIYVCTLQYIPKNESLSFELFDRMQKIPIKLQLQWKRQ